jgi:hypothetical protein
MYEAVPTSRNGSRRYLMVTSHSSLTCVDRKLEIRYRRAASDTEELYTAGKTSPQPSTTALPETFAPGHP